jgi:hypothetical protein
MNGEYGLDPGRYQMRTLVFGLIVTWVLIADPLLNVAQAEWYLSGYGGLVFPGNLTTAFDTQRFSRVLAVTEARISDIQLESNSMVYGAKAGFFFKERKWLGLETEVFTFFPNMTQQNAIVAQPGRTAFGATLPGARLQVTTLAVNLVTRDTTADRFNAYGGLGPAFFYVYSSAFPGKLTLTPGMNLTGGARYFVTNQFAVFGELKFHIVHFHFGGFSGDYSGQMLVGGLSYHFGNPVPRKD